MSTLNYFSATVPDPYRILGLTLRPLSLGRYRLLRRFNVGFVSDGETSAKPEDLLLGVLICSMRVDEFLEWANSPTFASDVRRWSRSVSPLPILGKIPFIGRWWRERFAFDLFEKFTLFKKYIDEHSRIPMYWNESESILDAESSGSHWSHNLEVSLRKEQNWTAEEINETPLSKAIADYFKLCESQGSIRLMDDDEIAEIERQRKLQEVADGV